MKTQTLLERMRSSPSPLSLPTTQSSAASSMAGTLGDIIRIPGRSAATQLTFGIRPLGTDRRITFDGLASLGWHAETVLTHARVGPWIVLRPRPDDPYAANPGKRDAASVDAKGRLRLPAAFVHLLGSAPTTEVLLRVDPAAVTVALAPAALLAMLFAELGDTANEEPAAVISFSSLREHQ